MTDHLSPYVTHNVNYNTMRHSHNAKTINATLTAPHTYGVTV